MNVKSEEIESCAAIFLTRITDTTIKLITSRSFFSWVMAGNNVPLKTSSVAAESRASNLYTGGKNCFIIRQKNAIFSINN